MNFYTCECKIKVSTTYRRYLKTSTMQSSYEERCCLLAFAPTDVAVTENCRSFAPLLWYFSQPADRPIDDVTLFRCRCVLPILHNWKRSLTAKTFHFQFIGIHIFERMTTKLKNDYDAFCRLKTKYSGRIADDDISDVWKFVHESMASLNLEGKFAAACSKIDDLVGSCAPDMQQSVNGEDDAIPSEPQFESFVLLCEDMFHISILQSIWKSLPFGISGEDKFDSAVMLAVERLGEQSSDDSHGTSLNATSVSRTNADQQSDGISLPLYDPNRKSKRKVKRNKIMSSQKAVLDMLEETFQGTGISLDTIQRVAEKNDYDPEQSIEGIWADYYRSRSLVREGVTFAEAAAFYVNQVTPFASVSSALVPTVSVTVPSNASSLSISNSNDEDRFLSDAAIKSHAQGQMYHRFAEHFLFVARKHNPTYNISLSRTGTLSFDGSMRSSRSNDFDEDLRVDLHGLVVLRGLELVESVMNYLYSLSPLSKSGKSRPQKKWRVKFVVGRGAHSSGGVAKLKPAVEKYLRRNGEHNVTVYDGEVHVELRSKSS